VTLGLDRFEDDERAEARPVNLPGVATEVADEGGSRPFAPAIPAVHCPSGRELRVNERGPFSEDDLVRASNPASADKDGSPIAGMREPERLHAPPVAAPRPALEGNDATRLLAAARCNEGLHRSATKSDAPELRVHEGMSRARGATLARPELGQAKRPAELPWDPSRCRETPRADQTARLRVARRGWERARRIRPGGDRAGAGWVSCVRGRIAAGCKEQGDEEEGCPGQGLHPFYAGRTKKVPRMATLAVGLGEPRAVFAYAHMSGQRLAP